MSYPTDSDSALTYGLGGPSDTIRLPGFAEASEEVPSKHSVVLGDQIGSGGVGEVFEAVQPSLGRTVAVKILRKATGQSLFGMFENEARITARLNHPNFLPVHDLIRIQESPALVMKRVYGESWEDRIRADRESGALTLVDHVLPEIVEEDGHARCGSTKTLQRVQRILSYLGRDAEADALVDAYLPKAKAELAEPGVQWRDAKAACVAELEGGA